MECSAITNVITIMIITLATVNTGAGPSKQLKFAAKLKEELPSPEGMREERLSSAQV